LAAAAPPSGRAGTGFFGSTGSVGAGAAAVASGLSSSSKSKLLIVCGLSSSVTAKSSCVRPRTTFPFLSRTTTLTSTSSVPTRNVGRVGGAGWAAAGCCDTGCCDPVCARGDVFSVSHTRPATASTTRNRVPLVIRIANPDGSIEQLLTFVRFGRRREARVIAR
jgi:hypothetical protein